MRGTRWLSGPDTSTPSRALRFPIHPPIDQSLSTFPLCFTFHVPLSCFIFPLRLGDLKNRSRYIYFLYHWIFLGFVLSAARFGCVQRTCKWRGSDLSHAILPDLCGDRIYARDTKNGASGDFRSSLPLLRTQKSDVLRYVAYVTVLC